MTSAAWAYGQQYDNTTIRNYEAGTSWDNFVVPTETAVFGLTKAPYVMISTSFSVGGWTFTGAGYQFNAVAGGVNFSGVGIIGGAGSVVINSGSMSFTNSAAAGSIALVNTTAGMITFAGSSTADHAVFSTASLLHFGGESTAANATIAVTKTGHLLFDQGATAGDADITTAAEGADIGQVTFSGDGPAHNHKLTAGSFAGSGIFDLGSNAVSVGSSLTDDDDPAVVDGQIVGSGDSRLIKVGEGRMVLNGLNTYGATLISDGVLEVNGTIGKVTVGGGNPDYTAALTGNGRVGALTVKDGYFSPGVESLVPGVMRTGSLTLSSASRIYADVRGTTPGGGDTGYDQIVVSGKVKLDGGLTAFQYTDEMTPGQVLTFIDNDGKDRVQGTFSNGLFYGRIEEGDRLLAGLNVMSVSYKGGNGNDVTLRVEGFYSYGMESVSDEKVDGTSATGEDLHPSTKFADVILTGSGSDRVDAGAGHDSVGGGLGKDVLNGGAGTDLVTFYSATGAVNVTLNGSKQVTVKIGGVAEDKIKNFEDVDGGDFKDKITGDKHANLLNGGDGADTVRGQAGNDVLVGDAGKDLLEGGGGRDIFVFKEIGAKDADKIKDFHHGQDRIMLDNFDLDVIGAKLDASEFYAGHNASKADGKHNHIIYDTKSGELYFDPDGKGGDGGVLFAILQGHPALSASDFMIG